jgi:hypothetical protein
MKVARMNAEDYANQAESFLADLNEEYFQHGAGLKEELALTPIYSRYHGLFELDTVSALLGDRRSRRGRYLAHFGAFGFVEDDLRELTEQIAAMEVRSTVEWDGEQVPHRKARVLASNEPDTARRHELERRIVAATEELNPQSALRLARAHAVAEDLGFADYVAMCDELAGLGLARLHDQTQRLLAATSTAYESVLLAHLASAGISPEEATNGDFFFVRRGLGFDPLFTKEGLVPALTRTLAGLGIALESQGNVKLDLEERPQKTPRAFCAPVRVPADVRLVIRPHGGRDDYFALFHEAGHVEHFACTRSEAPFPFRCLGDNSVTEAYAFVIGNLPSTPEWLRDVLGLTEFADYLSLARLVDLNYLRRYSAKLAYELELHRSPIRDELAARYAELLGEAVQVRMWPQNHLYDVDDFFYCACYLRAWMLEVQLRRRLIEQFGARWFSRKEAGDYLKDLWALGQEFTADELAQRLGYPGLQIEPLIEDLLSQDDS